MIENLESCVAAKIFLTENKLNLLKNLLLNVMNNGQFKLLITPIH